jgi:hypothetical protein
LQSWVGVPLILHEPKEVLANNVDCLLDVIIVILPKTSFHGSLHSLENNFIIFLLKAFSGKFSA